MIITKNRNELENHMLILNNGFHLTRIIGYRLFILTIIKVPQNAFKMPEMSYKAICSRGSAPDPAGGATAHPRPPR